MKNFLFFLTICICCGITAYTFKPKNPQTFKEHIGFKENLMTIESDDGYKVEIMELEDGRYYVDDNEIGFYFTDLVNAIYIANQLYDNHTIEELNNSAFYQEMKLEI